MVCFLFCKNMTINLFLITYPHRQWLHPWWRYGCTWRRISPHDPCCWFVINIALLHQLLGHPNKQTLRATAKHYNVSLTEEFCPCCDCATAKLKQTKIAKVSHVTSTKPGKGIYIDISSVKTETYGGSKFWLLIVDDYSNMCWSKFMPTKSASYLK
jgi:hypothetical protein